MLSQPTKAIQTQALAAVAGPTLCSTRSPEGQLFWESLWKRCARPQRPNVWWRDSAWGCSICRVTDEDFMLGVAAIITVSTPLALGLVALLRGRPEDYPEILRAVFRRKEKAPVVTAAVGRPLPPATNASPHHPNAESCR
jgi:hypothetical protein